MKKFNQVIEVQVSVDTIADKLCKMFSKEEKHAELVTETIIGNLLNKGTKEGISQLYNALNGYTSDIDFEVGDFIICHKKVYNNFKQEDGSFKERYEAIEEATVVDIDLYRSDKLKIEYNYMDSKGIIKTTQTWVSHLDCNTISLVDKIDVLA